MVFKESCKSLEECFLLHTLSLVSIWALFLCTILIIPGGCTHASPSTCTGTPSSPNIVIFTVRHWNKTSYFRIQIILSSWHSICIQAWLSVHSVGWNVPLFSDAIMTTDMTKKPIFYRWIYSAAVIGNSFPRGSHSEVRIHWTDKPVLFDDAAV